VKIIKIILIIFIIAFATGIFVFDQSDSIMKINIYTRYMIFMNNFVDKKHIVRWLEKYHGEAPNLEKLRIFIEWGTRNKQEFIKILRLLNFKTKEKMSWVVCDDNIKNIFYKEFEQLDSKDINFIVRTVEVCK
jgi:hypothetical protein